MLQEDSFSGRNDDWRSKGTAFGQALFKGDNFKKNLAVVENLREVAKSLRKTLPQLAINWVLKNQGVSVALTGCRNTREIEENIGAVGWTIPEDVENIIENIMLGAAGRSTIPFP
jgi:aryl-alcohol dehydrogenase-like predicted oxidoreductase